MAFTILPIDLRNALYQNQILTIGAQTAGSYLTGTGFTTATTIGTNIVGTLDSNGISLGVPAYLTTAALSQDSSKYAGTGFTSATTAGTNIVGTLNTAGLSVGIPAYLTTAALSQDSSKYAGTGTSATNASITLNTAGLAISVAAGATGTAGTGFTSATTAGTAIVGTLNSAGLSLGVPSYLTTAALSQDSSKYAGTGFTSTTTAGTAVVGTLATNGLSLGVPAYLTTAALSQDSSKYAGTGFTSTTTAGTAIVGTHNTAGLSLGVPAYLTTAALSQDSSKYAGTGFTSTTTAGTAIVGTQNTAGLSLGVPAYLTTAALSQDSSKYAGTGITTATTAGTAVVGTLTTNGLSLGVPAYITTQNSTAAAPVLSIWQNMLFSQSQWGSTNNTLHFFPLAQNCFFPGNMTVKTVRLHLSCNMSVTNASSQAHTYTFLFGIYTLNVSTLSLLNSASTTFGSGAANRSFSTMYDGVRWLTFNSSQFSGGSLTLAYGSNYIGAYLMRSSGTNHAFSILGTQLGADPAVPWHGTLGVANAGAATVAYMWPTMGMSSTTGTAMPNSMAFTDINHSASCYDSVPDVQFDNLLSIF